MKQKIIILLIIIIGTTVTAKDKKPGPICVSGRIHGVTVKKRYKIYKPMTDEELKKELTKILLDEK